jgi:transposase
MSVHDGWRSYWQYACQHALCNVHHLRELTYLYEEQQQQDWAGRMKTLLLDIKAAVEQARTEGRSSLHPLEVADWKAQYAALLAEAIGPTHPIHHPKSGSEDDANSRRRAICWIACLSTRRQCCCSWTISPCLLTIALPSATFGW